MEMWIIFDLLYHKSKSRVGSWDVKDCEPKGVNDCSPDEAYAERGSAVP